MAETIVVAGGTGNLGGKIIHALVKRGVPVVAPVRAGSHEEKRKALEKGGARVVEADLSNREELAELFSGASCVVSALHGLGDVILDLQTVLLEASVAAGVPRFIPSDFSVDFTKIGSENRNFDLRRAFHLKVKEAPLSATSIYNGAFADILAYNTPLLNFRKGTVAYWEDKEDWLLDFTTTEDVAAFTAAAALDTTAPAALHIASFRVSPRELAALAGEISGTPYTLESMGSLEAFAAHNRKERLAHPEGEKELYPKWQSGQYLHDQFSTHHEKLDNDRYEGINWTTAREFAGALLKQ